MWICNKFRIAQEYLLSITLEMVNYSWHACGQIQQILTVIDGRQTVVEEIART